MKGGGTIQGMVDMMREFQAEVVGVGVMIATAKPVEKRVKGVKSLFTLAEADARTGTVDISVSPQFR
jgi:purine operon repressor